MDDLVPPRVAVDAGDGNDLNVRAVEAHHDGLGIVSAFEHKSGE